MQPSQLQRFNVLQHPTVHHTSAFSEYIFIATWGNNSKLTYTLLDHQQGVREVYDWNFFKAIKIKDSPTLNNKDKFVRIVRIVQGGPE